MIDLKRSRVVGGEVYWKQDPNFQNVLLLNNIAIMRCPSGEDLERVNNCDRDKVCHLFDLGLGKISSE